MTEREQLRDMLGNLTEPISDIDHQVMAGLIENAAEFHRQGHAATSIADREKYASLEEAARGSIMDIIAAIPLERRNQFRDQAFELMVSSAVKLVALAV